MKAVLVCLPLSMLLGGCGGSSGDSTQASDSNVERSVQLVPTADPALLEVFLKSGLRQSSGMNRDLTQLAREDQTENTNSLDPTAPIALENDQSQSDAGSGALEEDTHFSTTNLQESGIDEADLVKYDGEYLYVANNYPSFLIDTPVPPTVEIDPVTFTSPTALLSIRQVTVGGDVPPARVVVAKTSEVPANSETMAIITLKESFSINGLYLFSSNEFANTGAAADRLVVVGSQRERCRAWDQVWCWRQGNTTVFLYDVSMPEVPTLIAEFETNAHRVATRRIGDKLLLTTRYAPTLPNFVTWARDDEDLMGNEAVLESVTLDDLLPIARLDGIEQGLVAPENCFIPPHSTNTSDRRYLTRPTLVSITQFGLTTLTPTALVCAAGGANGLYVSAERLFLYAQSSSETYVHGFALSEFGPVYQGTGVVPGTVGWQNQTFRFSAQGDYLRVINSQGFDHRLTVLKRNDSENTYETVAVLPNAERPAPIDKPNESIFGVRFMQDRAYVVTFLRTDPLYVLNLSNPEDPFIEGELELPGFSDYLHPINNYLLLGIGRAANDEGLLEGVKLALFDVSNPASPTALAASDIGDRGSRTPVSYDHKAFTWLPNAVEAGAHRFALPVHKYELVPENGMFSARSATVLSLWEIEDNVTTAKMTAKGEIDAPQRGGAMRVVIDQSSVHFVVDDAIVSAGVGHAREYLDKWKLAGSDQRVSHPKAKCLSQAMCRQYLLTA
jgi:hypothetical protein